jgi:DDE superfamily endonuclease
MVGVVSLCPGAPRGVCAAPDFSVDGAGVSGIIDSVESSGVSSMVRALGLKAACYRRLLYVCHSPGMCIEHLRACWTRLSLMLFTPMRLGGRLLVLGDGLKVAKEGRKMPAVKKLHQSSANNSKATYIFGHSLQALGLLVCGPLGHLLSVPLTSRIHEGLVFSNRERRTLLDKFVQLFLAVVGGLEASVLLVVDAYYASGKILRPLLAAGHHVLTRVRWNAVAYHPAPPPKQPRRGRPRRYGQKVRLWDLWSRHHQRFQTALSPVYGENQVTLRYYAIDLLMLRRLTAT